MADIQPIDPTLIKPWYKSKTLNGALVLVLGYFLSKYHVNFTGLQDSINAIVNDFLEFVGAVFVFWGRWTAAKAIALKATIPTK